MTILERLGEALASDATLVTLENLTRSIISSDPAMGRVRVEMALEALRSTHPSGGDHEGLTSMIGRLSRYCPSDALL